MSLLKDSNTEMAAGFDEGPTPAFESLLWVSWVLVQLDKPVRPRAHTPGGSDYRCTKAPRRIGLGVTCATHFRSDCIIICVSCTSCGYCFAGLPVGVALA